MLETSTSIILKKIIIFKKNQIMPKQIRKYPEVLKKRHLLINYLNRVDKIGRVIAN